MVAAAVGTLPPVGSRAMAAAIERRQQAPHAPALLELHAYPQRALPPHLREAAQAAATAPREMPSRGLPALRAAIAARVGRENNLTLDEANVVVTNGAMQALNVVMRALLDPHDEVVLPAPCYFFDGVVRLAGGHPVLVPMEERDGYAWDLDRIAAAITSRTKLLVISTPVNPTGYVPPRADLQALLDLATRHNLLILSDESYNRMLYDGLPSISIVGLPGGWERTIVVQSMSKGFALHPWRVGYVVAPAPLIPAFTKVLEWELLQVNHICQAVALAALEGPQDWLAGIADEFARDRDLLWPAVQATGVLQCPRPQGGPFLFLSARAAGYTSAALSHRLLWDWGIPTTSGEYFYMPHHARLAFGASAATLADLTARLAAAARQLGGCRLDDRGSSLGKRSRPESGKGDGSVSALTPGSPGEGR
jgi:aspartate/methionine/tyrosine aminotransferase